MLKTISVWVLIALTLVTISIPVAILGHLLPALYLVVLAVFSMQVAAREE